MKFQNWTLNLKYAALLVVALVGLTACPGKGGGGGGNPGPQGPICPPGIPPGTMLQPGQPGCIPGAPQGPMCPPGVAPGTVLAPGQPPCTNITSSGGNMLVSGYGRNYKRTIEAALTFTTSQVQPGVPAGQPLPNPLGYNGDASALGQVFVSGGLTNGTCNIPPGQYMVQTVRPATWRLRSFFGLEIVASNGPYQINIVFGNDAGVDPAIPPVQGVNGQYPYYVRGSIMINSLNGQDCKYYGNPFVTILE